MEPGHVRVGGSEGGQERALPGGVPSEGPRDGPAHAALHGAVQKGPLPRERRQPRVKQRRGEAGAFVARRRRSFPLAPLGARAGVPVAARRLPHRSARRRGRAGPTGTPARVGRLARSGGERLCHGCQEVDDVRGVFEDEAPRSEGQETQELPCQGAHVGIRQRHAAGQERAQPGARKQGQGRG